MNGILEFIDTNDMTVMAQTEHFMATDVEWDPTGRYVVSGVSWWGHKVSFYFSHRKAMKQFVFCKQKDYIFSSILQFLSHLEYF